MTNEDSLRWFGHDECVTDEDWVKHSMTLEFDGTRLREFSGKTWWDCVKNDIESFGPS